MVMSKPLLSEAQWQKIEPLLPSSNANAVVVRPKTIASYWKGFCGYSKPVLAGAICQEMSASVPVFAGTDFAGGTSKVSGCGSGGHSSVNWIDRSGWIGARAFWTGVLLPLKKGRRSRQNQAWQGYKVDGGGRRPRYSSGKPTDQRHPQRSAFCSTYTGSDQQPQTTGASHCRSRLRQQSAAPAFAAAGYVVDRSTPSQSQSGIDERWPLAATLSQTLEDRTHLCLAGQLSPPAGSLRPTPEYVLRVLSHRLRSDHLAFSTQLNLKTTSTD